MSSLPVLPVQMLKPFGNGRWLSLVQQTLGRLELSPTNGDRSMSLLHGATTPLSTHKFSETFILFQPQSHLLTGKVEKSCLSRWVFQSITTGAPFGDSQFSLYLLAIIHGAGQRRDSRKAWKGMNEHCLFQTALYVSWHTLFSFYSARRTLILCLSSFVRGT